MKRHRETILPPLAPKSPSPAAKGRVAAMSTQGEGARTSHAARALKRKSFSIAQLVEIKLFLCLRVDPQTSRQSDAEAHEKLTQNIEMDVVSVF